MIENGIAKVKEVFADRITTKQLCVEDICVDREQLKALLEKNQTQIIIQNQVPSTGSGQVPPAGEPFDNTQDSPAAEQPPEETQSVQQPSAEEPPTQEPLTESPAQSTSEELGTVQGGEIATQ